MSDKPHSQKPASQMPRISSSKPSSKMPKTEEDDTVLASAMFKDMSIAPQQNKISSSRTPAKEQDKKAKSTFSPIPEDEELDEEYDEFEELTTPKSNYPEFISPSKKQQSRVSSSSTYYDAKSNLPEKAKSAMPSAMFKDESKAPKAKSVMPSAMFKDESKAPKAKSVMPSAIFKDESKAPKAKSVMHSAMFKDESFKPKSYLVTKEDKIMSARQTHYTSLAPKEKKKQNDWAQKKIKEMGTCPEQYEWKRIDQGEWGGYVCAEGRHAMPDLVLAECLGAIIILIKKGDLAGEKAGPWYPHATIKNCYIYKERTEKLEGVKEYNQPAFLGSDHQIQRAKWEYYSENLDEAVKRGYNWPEKEPPKEWADEKNVPKTKEAKEVK